MNWVTPLTVVSNAVLAKRGVGCATPPVSLVLPSKVGLFRSISGSPLRLIGVLALLFLLPGSSLSLEVNKIP